MTYCLLLTVLSVSPADNSTPSGVSDGRDATVVYEKQIYRTREEAYAAAKKARLPILFYCGPRPKIYPNCVIFWKPDDTVTEVSVFNVVSPLLNHTYLFWLVWQHGNKKPFPTDQEIKEAIKRLHYDLRRY